MGSVSLAICAAKNVELIVNQRGRVPVSLLRQNHLDSLLLVQEVNIRAPWLLLLRRSSHTHFSLVSTTSSVVSYLRSCGPFINGVI